jgi:hypothetical protein
MRFNFNYADVLRVRSADWVLLLQLSLGGHTGDRGFPCLAQRQQPYYQPDDAGPYVKIHLVGHVVEGTSPTFEGVVFVTHRLLEKLMASVQQASAEHGFVSVY